MSRLVAVGAPLAISVALLGFALPVRAGYVPESLGLAQSVDKAEAALLCRVTSVAPDQISHPALPTQPSGDFIGNMWLEALQPPCTYQFHVIRVIEGPQQTDLRIHLPPIYGPFYYGQAKFKVQPGTCVLLLLAKAGPDGWAPVDNTVPLIPLGDLVQLSGIDWQNPEAAVTELMLGSLADPAVRRANTYLLRETQSVEVLKKMKDYLLDLDPAVKANVLSCMEFNQDISAIPLVAEMERTFENNRIWNGVSPIGGLQEYQQTPSAVPMLNEVLNSGPGISRGAAVVTLRNLADDSSIPFLMRAVVRDHLDGYSAYAALHRLLGPEAGPMLPGDEYSMHRDAEIQKLQVWLAAHPATQPATPKTCLLTELPLVTADCGLHFTFEYGRMPMEGSPLLDARIELRSHFASADAAVEFLRSQLPGFIVQADEAAPRIIHLVDKSLSEEPVYPMARRVTLEFTGTPSRLLARLGPLIDNPLQESEPGLIFVRADHFTPIAVSAKDLPVRSVLGDFLPLDEYNSMLWASHLAPSLDDPNTSVIVVEFFGPQLPSAKSAAATRAGAPE